MVPQNYYEDEDGDDDFCAARDDESAANAGADELADDHRGADIGAQAVGAGEENQRGDVAGEV